MKDFLSNELQSRRKSRIIKLTILIIFILIIITSFILVCFYFNNVNFRKWCDENVVNKLVEKYGQNLRFSAGVDSYVTLRVNEKNEKEVVERIKEVLITIAKN